MAKYKELSLTHTSTKGEMVYDPISGEEVEARLPIKLSKDDLDARTVEVLGFKFIDLGHTLACPTCGKISQIGCRLDVDKQIDWFLRFGCQHYNEEK